MNILGLAIYYFSRGIWFGIKYLYRKLILEHYHAVRNTLSMQKEQENEDDPQVLKKVVTKEENNSGSSSGSSSVSTTEPIPGLCIEPSPAKS